MIEYGLKYKKNGGTVISPSELQDQYFFGTPIVDSNGNPMSEENIRYYIEAAQKEVEKWLNIKITKQVISEEKDFTWADFREWGFMRLTYMCVKPISLFGFISDVQQIEYPQEWLSARKTSDGELYHRNLYLVPGNNAARTGAIVYSGITPHLGFLGRYQIPQYWKITYCTGFVNPPEDLKNFIGKLAAINIFQIIGDLILGAGIASQSLGIDGLSQSIVTTSSATSSGYGSRIISYTEDLKRQKPILESYYRGFNMTVA